MSSTPDISDKAAERKRQKAEKLAAKKEKSAQKAEKPVTTTEKAKPKVEKQKIVEEAYVEITRPGEKKDLSRPMANAYHPKQVESAWYQWWEEAGFFKPQLENGIAKAQGTFVIPIPPPNVTGSLHLGHALTNAIQDSLIRYNRMLGKTTLWNPGCDHAGIATQVVVEKKLAKERGINRHDMGRQPFIQEVWKWKDQYGDRIYEQLRRLGGSFDWSRAKFTMDPDLSKAVEEAFIRLHEEGIIYRENRLVNWCTSLKTALSNLEVENTELDGRTLMSVPDHDSGKKYEFGMLTSFAYPVDGSDEEIVVATTRLETMLGDTAVAVHPEDPRYKHLHGKFVKHPFQDRLLPIIADEMVEKDFGTGAVKITPGHDFNDYECGKRNNLEFINIMNDDGTLNQNAAPFEGVKRYEARVQVEKALEQKGLFRGKTANKMMLPICGRSGNVVEPLMKPQWWVRGAPLAAPAIEAVKSGQLEIIPKVSENEWFRWLENIQDWCISRQLWWGHSVPAYLVKIDGQADSSKGENWVAARSEEEAMQKAIAKFNVDASRITLEQDPDVLDTWFSSGLWPFSIFGWPDQTKDLELYYPNSLLETGWDILFFWVARMVMMGIKLTGKVPFRRVFCHAMVRDRYGRKMSKSLGNVIDPLDVIEGIALEDLIARLMVGNLDPREVEKAKEGQKRDYPNGIPECGTDALRFALCAYTSAGRDINLDILRVEGYRKFCNKLWNATKFCLMKLGDDYKPSANVAKGQTLPERWILNKLNEAIRETHKGFEAMNFMSTTSTIYSFWLYELCDVFIEVVKPMMDDPDQREAAKATLYTCLDQGLKLLHPFMPFVTEELYQRLPRRPNDTVPSIMLCDFPQVVEEWWDSNADQEFNKVLEAVRAARSLLSDYDIRTNATIYIVAKTEERKQLLQQQIVTIQTLVGRAAKTVEIVSDIVPGCALATVDQDCTALLLVKGVVDFDQEIAKLTDKKQKVTKSIDQLKQRMTTANYALVPDDVKEQNNQKIEQFEAEVQVLTKAMENFLRLKDE